MKNFTKTIEYLFYLFVFLLPIQTRWIFYYGKLGNEQSQYLTYSLYGTEILLGLFLFLGLIYIIKNWDHENYLLNYRLRNFYLLFFLLFLIIALSFIWSADKLAVAYYLWKFIEGFLLLLFIINFRFSFFNTAGALVLSGLVQAGLAIYQFITQSVFASKWLGMAEQIISAGGTSVVESEGFRWLRAYGTLPHPNILGGFLVIAFLLLIILLILARHKWEKIILWASLPIILTGSFFTFSKSAALATCVAIIFLGIFIFISPDKKDRNIFLKIILAGFAILSVLFLFYSDPVITRLKGETRLEIKSAQERIMYFDETKDLLKKYWLTGTGLGNYVISDFEQSQEKLPAYSYQPIHNVFFLAVVELGVWGFIVLVLIMAEICRRIYNYKIDYNLSLMDIFDKFKIEDNYNLYREKFYWFLGLTAVFFAIIIIMVFDHYLWTSYFGIILWWLLLGLWLKQINIKSV